MAVVPQMAVSVPRIAFVPQIALVRQMAAVLFWLAANTGNKPQGQAVTTVGRRFTACVSTASKHFMNLSFPEYPLSLARRYPKANDCK
jgi:hypothetical protein